MESLGVKWDLSVTGKKGKGWGGERGCVFRVDTVPCRVLYVL